MSKDCHKQFYLMQNSPSFVYIYHTLEQGSLETRKQNRWPSSTLIMANGLRHASGPVLHMQTVTSIYVHAWWQCLGTPVVRETNIDLNLTLAQIIEILKICSIPFTMQYPNFKLHSNLISLCPICINLYTNFKQKLGVKDWTLNVWNRI